MNRRSFLQTVAGGFAPGESGNNPMGDGKGIHPGRVVWVRDTNATKWDGASGHWWDDTCTNQKAVHVMISRQLQQLTGRKNDRQAWDALFRHFNSGGYRPGERIAIKINCNQDRAPEWGARNGLPSPHAIVALVTSLIEAGGVRGSDIMLYDVTGTRNVGQPILQRIRANTNREFQAVKFLVGADYNLGDRWAPEPDVANPVRFASAEFGAALLPRQVTEAKYMINMALLRAHTMAGVTLTAKNHFGSVHFERAGGWSPRSLHAGVQRTRPMGAYNPLVDLIGHPHLGGKTMLYILDGLYTAEHNEGNVIRWQSFNDQWAASMLMSQDALAIDSVGLDILRSEPRATQVRGNVDNYLHKAAAAGLGVHEHWNNAAERKYSRNLGLKKGIELIAQV